MALPKIQLPKHQVDLLTSNKSIWIRPFTVKEEKIILMASEGTNTDIAVALLQIIENCILDEDINVENLPFFECIYLFLNIKKISTSEEIKVSFKNQKDENGRVEAICNLNNDIIINNLDLYKNDKDYNLIQIENNDIYLRIKPLLYKDYIKLMKLSDKTKNDKGSEINLVYSALLLTIKEIFDKESTYDPSEYTLEELAAFYEDISFKDKDKIKKIYEKLPNINLKFHYVEDGIEKERIVEDINADFLM